MSRRHFTTTPFPAELPRPRVFAREILPALKVLPLSDPRPSNRPYSYLSKVRRGQKVPRPGTGRRSARRRNRR
jgi:hypothetical protein